MMCAKYGNVPMDNNDLIGAGRGLRATLYMSMNSSDNLIFSSSNVKRPLPEKPYETVHVLVPTRLCSSFPLVSHVFGGDQETIEGVFLQCDQQVYVFLAADRSCSPSFLDLEIVFL